MKKKFKLSISLALIAIMLFFAGCTTKDNYSDQKLKIEKFVEYWNTANFEGVEDVLCEDFELLESPKFEPKKGIELFKQTVQAYHKAYPDFKLVINEQVVDEDKAAGIWTITATKTGIGNNPTSGKRIEVIGISFVHFKDGKIKDEWISGNDYDWYQQLGYTFTPPAAEEN